MAKTETYTYTKTKARTEAVLDQFDMFLRYTGVNKEQRKKLLKGVEKKWFSAIGIFLVDSSGKRILEAEVGIDWKMHSDLAELSPTIRTDLPGWDDGAAPEIQVIGNRFGKRAQKLRTKPRYWVRFMAGIRQNPDRYKELCGKAGVSYHSSAPAWKSPPEGNSRSIADLSEVNVSMKAAT